MLSPQKIPFRNINKGSFCFLVFFNHKVQLSFINLLVGALAPEIKAFS
jgi:hypothetical protein